MYVMGQTVQKLLECGIWVDMKTYFLTMEARCSGFYFSIDLDEELRMKNIFWANERSRQTWLQCINSQAPNGIITDQDRAIQNIIQIVFSNTKHRWCLWHILKKLPQKFEFHVDKTSIFSTIHGLVYDSQFIEEFEKGWLEMIETYNLQDNEWLLGLYENRSHWVPCYLRTTFWAMMSTSQRSESMNAFFDGYVHLKTLLKSHMRVAVNYVGLVSTPVQLMYDKMVKSFATLENLTCDDDAKSGSILKWIES
ncbi:protein FAR-RED IMPAIRED RESPONSE 1-like [Olea europaea var. sylvestris]|uniref:protein FAR-RED IMPAIRED RESPONSE 1-like n=1 Tax=Olea europaea var. sylvestris TaxID=158386 RepID=UPI000C1D112A|nr:protein FAR-RED IMPAIRED RESPONSE 1-like [Olea europaea var. sylvestris]